MKVIRHITGKVLTLKFNHEGALSSAQFEGQNVISELRSIRESNFISVLAVFGFSTGHVDEHVKSFAKLNSKLNKDGFSIVTCNHFEGSVFDVFVCNKSDPSFIVKKPLAVIRYDLEKKLFTEVVKVYNDSFFSVEQKLRA